MAGYLGIDPSSSGARPTACIGLDGDLRLIYSGLILPNSEIIGTARRGYAVVAIDAPLSLPEGLCCLDPGCPCRPRSGKKGRACEREMARLGIPSYFTTKRSIIKDMVGRGIRLKEELEAAGGRVIEVYPYASKLRLFGRPIPRKTMQAGLAFLRERIVGLMPGLAPYVADFNHDLCDAAIVAYTAYLYARGQTQAYGTPEEGVIHIPLPRNS